MTSILIHIRITRPQSEQLAIAEWLKGKTHNLLSVSEVGKEEENPHSHTIILYNKTISTLRQQLIKEFPILKTGNRNQFYAISEKNDIEAQERYLCKGNSLEEMPYVLTKTFKYTDEYIKKKHEEYWEINKSLKESGPLNSGADKKPRTLTFPQYCVEEMGNEMAKNMKYDNDDHKYLVFKHVMKCLGKKGKIIDEFIIRRLVNGVFNIIDPRGTQEYFYRRVFPPMEQIDNPNFDYQF